jgi:hypothetical protein
MKCDNVFAIHLIYLSFGIIWRGGDEGIVFWVAQATWLLFFFWCFWVGLLVMKPKGVYWLSLLLHTLLQYEKAKGHQDDQESFLTAVTDFAASVQPSAFIERIGHISDHELTNEHIIHQSTFDNLHSV